ncbi:hypothetical protein ACFC1D_15255 [Streptomyces vinaceus]|uniref:hypothetical protein n=1 Tax=Streptomyces vinaceus TaxID=1960 RepID=UPI0035E2C996
MIERIYRALLAVPFVARPDFTIPPLWPIQTAVLSTLSVVLRFGSVLSAGALAMVALGAPHEFLLMVAPVTLSDRSAVVFSRVRRS